MADLKANMKSAVLDRKKQPYSRQAMDDKQRRRYFSNVSSHRPFELQLLRWNHDQGYSGEDPDEDSGRAAFQQLECLVGKFRQLRDTRPGGGITWCPLELAGVFLRHRRGRAMVWLPEAGGNFLLQAVPQGCWFLVEVGHLEKRRFVENKTKRRDGDEISTTTEATFMTKLNDRARVWEADPHLTDDWLQAAEDLREVWDWDWRALRQSSEFELAIPKFVYTNGYPAADATRGFHGEERFRWSWTEDLASGILQIRNQCWCSDVAQLYISEDEVYYTGRGGQQLFFGPFCSWSEPALASN